MFSIKSMLRVTSFLLAFELGLPNGVLNRYIIHPFNKNKKLELDFFSRENFDTKQRKAIL